MNAAAFGAVARLWQDRRLLAGVGLIAVLASALAAASVMFSEALAVTVLRERVDQAEIVDAGVVMTARASTADIDTLARDVDEALDDVPSLESAWVLAESDSFSPPIETIGERRSVATLGWWDGDVAALGLVEGRAPAERAETAIHVDVATALSLAVGDTVTLSRRGATLDLVVVGLFDPAPDRRLAPVPSLTEGAIASDSFVELGPMLVTLPTLVDAADRVSLTWTSVVDSAALVPADIPSVMSSMDDLTDRLSQLDVETSLAAELGEIRTALAAAGATIDALVLSLALLALMGLGTAVAAVIDRRRVEIELIRSRGAGPLRMIVSAALESGVLLAFALALAVPAGAALIAVGDSQLGGLSEGLDGSPGWGPFMAAAAVAAAALIVMVAPAGSAAAGFATARAARSRPPSAGVFQRTGLDLIVAVAAAAAVWRMTQGWSPVGGVDPLVSLAPALVWLTGMVLLARLAPWMLRMAERWTAGAAPTSSMVLTNTARRPDRVKRRVVLLASGAAIVVFTATYATTWRSSQLDQARLELGAAALATAGTPTWEAIGDGEAGPTRRWSLRLGTAVPHLTLVALDSRVSDVRSDLISDRAAWASLSDRPRAADLQGRLLSGEMEIESTQMTEASLAAVTADRFGVIRVSEATPLTDGQFSLDLGPGAPFRLLGLQLRTSVPGATGQPTSASLSAVLTSVAVDGEAVDLDGIPLRAEGGTSPYLSTTVSGQATGPDSVALDIDVTNRGPNGVVGATLVAERESAARLTGFATPGLLQAAGVGVGDVLSVPIGGLTPDVEIVGTIDALPTAPRDQVGLVVDFASLTELQWLQATEVRAPDQVMLPAGSPATDTAEEAVTVDGLAGARSADPASLGVLGSLGMGAIVVIIVAIAATVFATGAAVGDRTLEFALLEALGFTGGGVRRIIRLESLIVGAMGAIGGVVVGLALAAVAVPALTVDSAGRPVLPAPRLVIPWIGVGAIVAGTLLAAWLSAVAASLRHLGTVGTVIRAGEER